MRTATVKNVNRLSHLVSFLGWVGVCGGIAAQTVLWVVVSAILWWLAGWLIDRAWMYAGRDTYVVYNGVVFEQIGAACYVFKRDFPKGTNILSIKSDVAAIEIELLLHSFAEGGCIAPLKVTIGVVAGRTFKEAGLYFQHFVDCKMETGRYVRERVEAFLVQQKYSTGVFGSKQEAFIGTVDWIDHVFSKSLWTFLVGEFALVGLRVTAIGVIPGNKQKTILLKENG